MYAPVHHGNNPVLYSNYLFKGKGRRPFRVPGRRVHGRGFPGRVFRAPGRRNFRGRGFITKDQAKEGLTKAAKVGLPLIGKLIKGVSKQQRRKKRRDRKKRRKLRKLKGGTLFHNFWQGPGKAILGVLALGNTLDKHLTKRYG